MPLCLILQAHAVSSDSQACITQNTLVLAASDISVCRPYGCKARQFHRAAHVEKSLKTAEESWLLALWSVLQALHQAKAAFLTSKVTDIANFVTTVC